MRARGVAWTILLVVTATSAMATAAPARDDRAALRAHVEFLASESLEGRLTGSDGEAAAAAFLAGELERLGARPIEGAVNFYQPFEFTAGVEDAGSRLSLVEPAGEDARTWRGIERVRALSFSDNGTSAGAVVFAGYGITLPEGSEPGYDSYAGLDVKDKIVLVLRYSPEDVEGDFRAALARYSGPRYKALRARELGARALLIATGPRSVGAGETIGLSFDAAIAGSGLVAASIGGEVAGALFAGTGRDLTEVQRLLDTGNPHVSGFDLGASVELEVKVARERREGRNVIGVLPALAPDGAAPGPPRPALVLGAHYDHLGRGNHGNSLAKKEEAGQVHRGADDNASGVAALLAAGAELAQAPRTRPVVLAFWSGEELGLLGSTHFIKHDARSRERIAAYVNLDMVGRMRDNRLNLQGVASSTAWPRLIEQSNASAGFDVRMQEDPYLPTDAMAFYQAGIPTLSLFTGSHEDYHRPSDVPAAVNYDDLARVARFTARLAGKLDRLAEEPDYVKVERTARESGDRDSRRGYTGTIPDYATEVEGLRLSGVIGGGPADLAGLRAGDVIVEFDGRAITNIYDYTYALDAVKVDKPVHVVILRDGVRQEVTMTPARRP